MYYENEFATSSTAGFNNVHGQMNEEEGSQIESHQALNGGSPHEDQAQAEEATGYMGQKQEGNMLDLN